MVLRALHIDDTPSDTEEFVEAYKKAGIEVTFVRSVRGAMLAAKRKEFDLVTTDLEIRREMHQKNIPTPLEFLHKYQSKHPKVILSIVAGVNYDMLHNKKFAGIQVIPKGYAYVLFPKFLHDVAKDPVAFQPKRRISISGHHAGIIHTAAGGGKKRLINLVRQAKNEPTLDYYLRMGWRPKHKGNLAQGLAESIRETKRDMPQQGTAFAKILSREQRLAEQLKKLKKRHY